MSIPISSSGPVYQQGVPHSQPLDKLGAVPSVDSPTASLAPPADAKLRAAAAPLSLQVVPHSQPLDKPRVTAGPLLSTVTTAHQYPPSIITIKPRNPPAPHHEYQLPTIVEDIVQPVVQKIHKVVTSVEEDATRVPTRVIEDVAQVHPRIVEDTHPYAYNLESRLPSSTSDLGSVLPVSRVEPHEGLPGALPATIPPEGHVYIIENYEDSFVNDSQEYQNASFIIAFYLLLKYNLERNKGIKARAPLESVANSDIVYNFNLSDPIQLIGIIHREIPVIPRGNYAGLHASIAEIFAREFKVHIRIKYSNGAISEFSNIAQDYLVFTFVVNERGHFGIEILYEQTYHRFVAFMNAHTTLAQ